MNGPETFDLWGDAPHHPTRNTQLLSDDQMLPMINIVFLLLIFFMLVGALATPAENGFLPPQSASTLIPEQAEFELVIDELGTMQLGARTLGLEALTAAANALPSGALVSIKADANLAATDVVDVLDVLRNAGVQRVQLVTLAKH